MGKRNHKELCKTPGLGLQKWRGEWLLAPGDGEAGLIGTWDSADKPGKYLDLTPSSLLPVLPVGRTQQNAEGKKAHFHGPRRLAI